jgi:hypothetical protein
MEWDSSPMEQAIGSPWAPCALANCLFALQETGFAWPIGLGHTDIHPSDGGRAGQESPPPATDD